MSDPFITPDDLTEYLGRDVTANDSAVMVCDAACDMVRDATMQTFNQVTDDVVTLNGSGTDALLLPQVPVTSVSAVSTRTGSGAWTAAGSADFSLNGDGVLYAADTAGTSGFGSAWPLGRQNVRVTYTHGYTTAGTAATLPRTVKMIALTVASRLLLQGVGIFENLGDLNIRYATESTSLLPTERLYLRRYQRNRHP